MPTLKAYAPGIILTLAIAFTAKLTTIAIGGPILLYALVLGMAAKQLADKAGKGIQFSAKTILRIGVALLGFRISVSNVVELGVSAALLVMAGVASTILFGIACAKFLKFEKHFGILTGGATAICGASAALAISSVLPDTREKERETTYTIVAVTTLSTILMVVYPPLLHFLETTNATSGLFIGATVHDVAQVVGAGYSVSPETGDLATVTKLFRVALLVPVTITLAAMFRSNGTKQQFLPWFLMLFVAFAALNSLGYAPSVLVSTATTASQWCLCLAIAALGTKTSVTEIKSMGIKPLLLTILETLFLIVFITTGIALIT